MRRLSGNSSLMLLLVCGCGDSTAAPNRPAHLDPPPVPREFVTRDPRVERVELPSGWQTGDPPVVLPTFALREKIIVRWRPPDPPGERLQSLPSVIFKIKKERPGEKPLYMNTKGFMGQKVVPGVDACEAEIEVPPKPGEYTLEVWRNGETYSQAILKVEAIKQK